jgi:hypothetical protein
MLAGPAAMVAGAAAAISASVSDSVCAGAIGPTRMIAVTDSARSRIMNARVASST